MAVTPAKNASTGKSAAGARFRQRKISVKVALPIYNQNELTGTDLELEPSQLHHLNAASQQARDAHAVETGVDKNEEDEVHLQQVINAAQQALSGVDKDKPAAASSVYIPTPDASRLWPLASQYYGDKSFIEPDSYIKFSATVEDTLGIEYNMDEVDEKFFKDVLGKEYPKTSAKSNGSSSSNGGDVSDDSKPCSELEFEALCDKFEKTIEAKQPFLSMDPSTILSYEELRSAIVAELSSTTVSDPYSQFGPDVKYISTSTLKENLSKELNFKPFVTTFDKDQKLSDRVRLIQKLLELFGEPVYNHWRARKIERKGKTIAPVLKFEDPSANEKDNDNDPYICFRRREFRQARKTRRADNLGAERIRSLQRSLKRARELVLNVCQRELLKLQSWESEYKIFKLRCEAKGVKRSAGIKGDDHLFYSHKRKKIVVVEPPEEEEPEMQRIKREKKKPQDSVTYATTQVREQRPFSSSLQPEASSTQPYVKLPPSKIPDLDLETAAAVLKAKNEQIKNAVSEKLRKRKEHDKGWVNITYDPYQPFFSFNTNKSNSNIELSHIPYSSIAANYIHQFSTSNVISDRLKRAIEDCDKPLPGMKTFSGSNGEMVPSKPFPHLQTLLSNHLNNKENGSHGYIAQLLNNIEKHDFSSYTNGFSVEKDASENAEVSGPVFRLRKRAGRANRVFVDRRGLFQRPTDEIDEWLNCPDSDEENSSKPAEKPYVKDAYHNKKDAISRLDSQWRFSDDFPEYDNGVMQPFSLEPSRLNYISDDTQLIRFGLMLLSKSYDALRESFHNRQLAIQTRLRALQKQQQQQQQHQDSNGSRSSGGASGNSSMHRSAGAYSSANSSAGSGVSSYNANMNRSQSGYAILQALQLQRQQIAHAGNSGALLNSSMALAPKGYSAQKRGALLNSRASGDSSNLPYGSPRGAGVELKK